MNVHEELLVGGEWRKPASKARISVVCPSTEEVIAEVARRVHTGTFSVNAFVYNSEAPFGGVKNSGIGRDTGPEAVQAYYEVKTINLDPPTAALFS